MGGESERSCWAEDGVMSMCRLRMKDPRPAFHCDNIICILIPLIIPTGMITSMLFGRTLILASSEKPPDRYSLICRRAGPYSSSSASASTPSRWPYTYLSAFERTDSRSYTFALSPPFLSTISMYSSMLYSIGSFLFFDRLMPLRAISHRNSFGAASKSLNQCSRA